MTREEFLEALGDTGYKWHVGLAGAIRVYEGDAHCHCPITAVLKSRTGVELPTWQYQMAGRRLDMGLKLIEDVVCAADGVDGGSPLWRQMLNVLGFEEDRNGD